MRAFAVASRAATSSVGIARPIVAARREGHAELARDVRRREDAVALLRPEIGKLEDLLVPGDHLAVGVEHLHPVRHLAQDRRQGCGLGGHSRLGAGTLAQLGAERGTEQPGNDDEAEHREPGDQRLDPPFREDRLAGLADGQHQGQAADLAIAVETLDAVDDGGRHIGSVGRPPELLEDLGPRHRGAEALLVIRYPHLDRAVGAEQGDRPVAAERHALEQVAEIVEVERARDDPGETPVGALEPAREIDPPVAHRFAAHRRADEEAGAMVALDLEEVAIGKIP